MKTAGQLVQTVSIIDTISQLASNGTSGLDSLKTLSSSSASQSLVDTPSLRGLEISRRMDSTSSRMETASLRGMDLSTSTLKDSSLRSNMEKFRFSQHNIRKIPSTISPSRYSSSVFGSSPPHLSTPMVPRPLPTPQVSRPVPGPQTPRTSASIGQAKKSQTPPRTTPVSRGNLGISPRSSSQGRSPAHNQGGKLSTGSSAQFSLGTPFLNSTMRSPPSAGGAGEAERRRRRLRKVGGRSKGGGEGETPDWIRDLFVMVRRGNLDKLVESLEGTERGILRNLTDHLGNNLVHTSCQFGHAHILGWLANRLGLEVEAALADENKHGLTPPTLAIKYGRLDVLIWLVRNTRTADRLQSRDGERSLLHYAAKYGQDGIVSWLSNEMVEEGVEVDQMDLGGNTPLHLAARSGRTKTASVLLGLGASVNMKNDMGLKPCDSASLRGKESTSEFLLMFETSLGITRDLLTKERTNDTLFQENSDIKSSFREVLNVSKKLAKEREEMCRELSRLEEMVRDLHSNIIKERELHPKSEDGSVVSTSGSLVDKLEEHRNLFFGSSLADLEHRIMLAEDSAKKSRLPSTVNLENSYCHRHFRDRLEEIRGSCSSLAAASNLNSSPSTESEDKPETDIEEDKSEDIDFYESMKTPTGLVAQRQKLATPSPMQDVTSPPPPPPPSFSRRKKTKSETSLNESVYSSLGSPIYSAIGSSSHYQDVEAAAKSLGLDYPSAKAAAAEIVRNISAPGHGTKEEKVRLRDQLKKRLQQLALTSETGTASVIEVIEPDSSEEEEFKKSFSWSANKEAQQQQLPGGGGGGGRTAAPTEDRRSTSVGGDVNHRSSTKTTSEDTASAVYVSRSHLPRTKMPRDPPKNERLSEPDILHGTHSVGEDRRLPSADPRMLTTTTTEAASAENKPENGEDEIFCDYDTEPSPELSERPDSVLSSRKKGFLKKLSIAKWTAKKKMTAGSKHLDGKDGQIEPDYVTREANSMMRKSLDDLDVGGGSSSKVEAEESVTRIEVCQEAGEQGGDQLERHVSHSLSPGSRKSLYSGYLRPDLNAAKSDDSGIIATSRPDSSTSILPVRKSYSGSSDQSDLSTGSAGIEARTEAVTAAAAAGEAAASHREDSGSGSSSVSRISEVGNQTTIVISSSTSSMVPMEANNNIPRKSSSVRSKRRTPEKPWYDVSDEEVDLTVPDHITSIISVRGSSDDDVF